LSSASSRVHTETWSYKFQWAVLFVLATYALSRVFESSRAITGGLPEASWSDFSIWAFVLLMSFLLLAMESYRNERAKGTVLRAKGAFELLDRILPPFPVVIVASNKEGHS
jgi:hypothetical protein